MGAREKSVMAHVVFLTLALVVAVIRADYPDTEDFDVSSLFPTDFMSIFNDFLCSVHIQCEDEASVGSASNLRAESSSATDSSLSMVPVIALLAAVGFLALGVTLLRKRR